MYITNKLKIFKILWKKYKFSVYILTKKFLYDKKLKKENFGRDKIQNFCLYKYIYKKVLYDKRN